MAGANGLSVKAGPTRAKALKRMREIKRAALSSGSLRARAVASLNAIGRRAERGRDFVSGIRDNRAARVLASRSSF